MPFLLPNQRHQSTEALGHSLLCYCIADRNKIMSKFLTNYTIHNDELSSEKKTWKI